SLPFAKEPIGLVTPIGDMLDAWDPDLPAKPSMSLAATAADAIPNPLSPAIAISNSQLAPLVGQAAGLGGATVSDTTTFEPVMTPVMVSGMSAQGIARLATVLAPLHLMPMAGGGPPSHVSAAERKAARLVPGAAVGVSLVQGDIDETAIGTLTYRDGNRVIAFGHPFTGIGPIDAALTTASITDLFPSYQDSTKLGSPIETVGRIFQDRPFSVGGIIGSMPHMVPVTVTIHDESDNRTKYFHARVINHPLLTGPLISQVADQAILQTHGTPGDAIAMVTTDINAEQIGHIVRKNIFYDPLSIDQTATGDLDNAMRMLSANPFYPLAVKSVSMTVTIESKHPTAQIDHIILPKATYAPGDTIEVGVVLKPYRREPTLMSVPLTIPSTAPDGPVMVQVRGGASAGGNTISLGGGLIVIKPTSPIGPPAANITQLVHQYLEEPRNNDLVASLQLPSTALDIQGEKLTLLPPTMSAVMRSEHSSGLKLERDEVKKTIPMAWIISGQQSLTINVARKDVTDQSSSSAGGSTSPVAPTDTAAPATSAASSDDSDDNTDVSSADNSSDDGDGSTSANGIQLRSMSALNPQRGATGFEVASVVRRSGPKTASSSSMQATTSSSSAPGATPPSTESSEAAAATKPTPVGRLASIWRQDTASAFQEGTLDNVTISSRNDLRLSASLSAAASSTAPYIWTLAVDKRGNLFAGTGDEGIIYKVSGSKMAAYCRTGEIEVSSLVYDPNTGNLYAGTAPHGAVFRITPDGKGTKIFSTAEKYVTALALSAKGDKLYAATGGGQGKVYAIPLASPTSGKVLFTSPEAHLQSLAIGSDGQIYAGGSPDGLIYTINPDGSGKILYDAAEPNISCLTVDANNTVYAGTSPKGVIYKIVQSAGASPNVTKLIPGGDTPIYGLSSDSVGTVWACSGNNILRVAGDGTVLTYAAGSDVSFISLALGGNGQVYAGTNNIGTIYTLGSVATGPAQSGTYTSPVHDAKLPAKWGTIAWQASVADGSSVQMETRSGDVNRPDDTWSAWSGPYTDSTGQTITSPPGRFIQYRAILSGNITAAPAALPRVQSVAIYYLTQNQAPTVKFLSPTDGDAVSGQVTLRWNGADPDKDTLSYSVLYSTDGGKTWQPIKKALQVSDTASPLKTQLVGVANSLQAQGVNGTSDADVAKAMVQFKQQLDQHPDIPPAVRAQMLQQAPAVIRQAMALKQSPGAESGTASTGDVNGRVTATSYKWDTKNVPDGTYEIKVMASDAPSNPTDAQTAEAISAPFIVDNTPPTVVIDPARTSIDTQKHIASLHGIASTKLSFIEAVQYRIDSSQDWSAAAADSGLFDTRSGEFTITTPALSVGAHTVTVQAIDQAGNTAQATTQFVIP
ncbi:MAG TPA: Ig-like domain-containing protein, partial [Capsulimonadaceae bacterium]|nr:Ig-like domain-containing protein [Capsulimonadaceae bacterium]